MNFENFEIWQHEDSSLTQLLARVRDLKPEDLVAAQAAYRPNTKNGYAVEGAVAVVDLSGMMMLDAGWREQYFLGAISTRGVAAQIDAAAADDAIKAILIRADSGGGTASSWGIVSDAVKAAGKQKLVMAHVERGALSAAYAAIAPADRIVAADAAMLGSIGTYWSLVDSSKLFEKMGLTVHVLKSGENKGIAEPGSQISEANLAHVQGLVDSHASLFKKAVADGRGMDVNKVASIADGRAFMASEARAAGLIDAVASLGDMMKFLTKQTAAPATGGRGSGVSSNQQGAKKMFDESSAVSAARSEERQRIAGIMEAFPGNTEFAQRCIREGFSVEKSKAVAYDDKIAAAAKPVKLPGNKALGGHASGPSSSGSDRLPGGAARSEWDDEIRAEMAATKCDRTTAARRVNARNPSLREAADCAANPGNEHLIVG